MTRNKAILSIALKDLMLFYSHVISIEPQAINLIPEVIESIYTGFGDERHKVDMSKYQLGFQPVKDDPHLWIVHLENGETINYRSIYKVELVVLNQLVILGIAIAQISKLISLD